MRYAFINAEGIVVNLIVGALSPIEQHRLLADYRVLFGAVQIVAVDDGASVWIGGTYDPDSGTFTPPPTPEPEPIVVDAPIEVIEEILSE
jgi:hypothetical protein